MSKCSVSANYTAKKNLDSSAEVVEKRSRYSASTDNIQEILLDAQRNASYKKTLDYLSGCGSRPWNVSKFKLKPV